MNEQMKNVLFSYVKNGIDKGCNLEKINIVPNSNGILFQGSYKETEQDGYINNDIGTMQGEVRYIDFGTSRKVAIKADYIGIKNGTRYNYTVTTAFEAFDNGLVYKTSKDSRDGLLTETYYKASKGNNLRDYTSNCSNPISLYEGDYQMTKTTRR